nr:unnamed protein product [Callosobruchus analis]
MALLCATCSKAIITSQVNIACSKCLKCFHASCVSLTANEVTFLNDSTDKWSCPVCCRQGRITRSNSSSSGVRPGTPTRRDTEGSSATDTLALILSQLSAVANDIKDIKSSQAQLSTDVAYCRTCCSSIQILSHATMTKLQLARPTYNLSRTHKQNFPPT